jgi:hypothetical protein
MDVLISPSVAADQVLFLCDSTGWDCFLVEAGSKTKS